MTKRCYWTCTKPHLYTNSSNLNTANTWDTKYLNIFNLLRDIEHILHLLILYVKRLQYKRSKREVYLGGVYTHKRTNRVKVLLLDKFWGGLFFLKRNERKISPKIYFKVTLKSLRSTRNYYLKIINYKTLLRIFTVMFTLKELSKKFFLNNTWTDFTVLRSHKYK